MFSAPAWAPDGDSIYYVHWEPLRDGEGALSLVRRHRNGKVETIVRDIRPEWWAWYGAYDHVALCSVFGRMVDLPDGWPMLTMDLKQMHKAAGYPQMPKQPAGLHNALEDARWNVERYRLLEEKLNERPG